MTYIIIFAICAACWFGYRRWREKSETDDAPVIIIVPDERLPFYWIDEDPKKVPEGFKALKEK